MLSILTKGQAWYMDFIFGAFIFTVTFILFYKFVPNIEHQELDNFLEVHTDAKTITNALTTKGYPYNWTNTTVQRIGITNGQKIIVQQKLETFHNMTKTQEGYDNTRQLFNLKSDYLIVFTDRYQNPVNLSTIRSIGSPEVNFYPNNKTDFTSVPHSNIVALKRLLVYNQIETMMVIYTWY